MLEADIGDLLEYQSDLIILHTDFTRKSLFQMTLSLVAQVTIIEIMRKRRTTMIFSSKVCLCLSHLTTWYGSYLPFQSFKWERQTNDEHKSFSSFSVYGVRGWLNYVSLFLLSSPCPLDSPSLPPFSPIIISSTDQVMWNRGRREKIRSCGERWNLRKTGENGNAI